MKTSTLILIALISFSLCDYSGIKVAITSEIFKILTKFDLNTFLQNKTIIDHAEASGKYLFNYDVVCENLTITNIISPSEVTVTHSKTSEDLPQVQVILTNIELAIQIDYLYVKYGLIKETMEHPTGDVILSSLEFTFSFTKEGNLVIGEINVEIEKLDIDVRKDFLNWLIGLFEGLIKSEVTKNLESLGDTICEEANNMINSEFIYDVGKGIGLNLTFLTKPQLTQIVKSEIFGDILLQLAKVFLLKDESSLTKLQDTLTSILTLGLKGECFPIEDPDAMPEFTPAVNMDFDTSYFTNEIQVLISTYTLNTLLFMGQYLNLLQYEFTNSSHPIFPWNFDTQGLSELFPEFAQKYSDQIYEVGMKASITPSVNERAYLESTITGAKLVVNFNLDFLTYNSENPTTDLSLTVTGEYPFTTQVKYDLLTINWGTFTISNLQVNKNELNVDYEGLETKVANMWNTYVTKFLKGYTKNVALASILTLVTKMEFKNFKLETREGHILGSIAAKLD